MNNGGERAAGKEYQDLELLGRLLVGLLYSGGDELLSRLRASSPAVEADVEAYAGTVPGDETMGEMVSYLALGTMLRGQRRMARRMRRGIDLSKRAAGWALGTADRLTRNRLARPFRQPVERQVWAALLEGQQAIAEGRREARTSRLLAERTVEEAIDDLLDAVIQNPELMASMQRLVRQQSVGLTGTVTNHTRQLTVSADDVAEGIVRRLLRRGPRPALSLAPGIPVASSDGVEDNGTSDNP